MQSPCVRSMSEVIELLLQETSFVDIERELDGDAAVRANLPFGDTGTEMCSRPAATAPPDLQ
jgi:hypothetical protein